MAIDAIVRVKGWIYKVATAPRDNQTIVTRWSRTGAGVKVERPIFLVERRVYLRRRKPRSFVGWKARLAAVARLDQQPAVLLQLEDVRAELANLRQQRGNSVWLVVGEAFDPFFQRRQRVG